MLTIRDLVKVYPGPVTALQGINLDVPPGMFGLLGPNGAGKSTLMKILSGLLEATSGAVFLDGEDVLSKPERIRQRLGYLPQEFGFYPHLTGEKMLTYLLKLKGVEAQGGLKSLVAELLERVNLTAAAKRKVKTYSGGMRQRLGIAQAIAGDPRLIIVDEPTAGLDPEERQRFHSLLADISEQVIVILSTHIVADVSDLCRRMAILHGGRVVAQGDPLELTAGLRGRIWRKVVDRETLAEHQRQFAVIATRRAEGRIVIHVHGDGLPGPGFEPIEPDLEDAYFWAIRGAGAAPAARAAE